MESLETFLQKHPRADERLRPARANVAQTLTDAAATATACADACLAEQMVANLRRCIRLNLELGDLCQVTARSLLRLEEQDAALLRPILTACLTIAQNCREECERHASKHEHCRLCAIACRDVMRVCNEFLGLISDSGVGTTPALARGV